MPLFSKSKVDKDIDFLGCTITPLKEANDVYKNVHNKEDIIVVSTCYFLSAKFKIDDNTFKYINELIANIESFQMKIDRFTTHPERWIYRVYIDDTIFNIENIIKKKFSDENTKNKNIVEIIENFNYTDKNGIKNIKKLSYITLLLKTYIDKIKTSLDDKYKQIELYMYSNNNIKYKSISGPLFNISGHAATFGTLIRYHPLTDSRIGYCIMRNCSTNFSPLDIMIQNYWINTNKKKYMEYKLYNYRFKSPAIIYDQMYRQIYGQKLAKERSGAGLLSVKLKSNKFEKYIERFKEIKKKYIDINFKFTVTSGTQLNTKYGYGIDEIVIDKIFPTLREYKENFCILLSESVVKSYLHNDFIIKKDGISINEKCREIKNEDTNDIITEINKKSPLYCGLKVLVLGKQFFFDTSDPDILSDEEYQNIYDKGLEDLEYLSGQDKTIYNYIGTKFLHNINTFQVSDLPEMAIIKSFDYKIKYNFYFNDINNINNEMVKILTQKLVIKDDYKIWKLIELNLSSGNIQKSVTTYIETLKDAYSLDNFKPLIIYPKQFNLETYSETGKKEFLKIGDFLTGLTKHGLTFQLQKTLEKLVNNPNYIYIEPVSNNDSSTNNNVIKTKNLENGHELGIDSTTNNSSIILKKQVGNKIQEESVVGGNYNSKKNKLQYKKTKRQKCKKCKNSKTQKNKNSKTQKNKKTKNIKMQNTQ